MPFYEYECSACKFYVEALQKISEEPLRKCPSCKKQTLKRLVSAPVFRLKGGGWYETDFKSDGEQKRNIAGREETGEKSEDTKAADAKPAADAAKGADSKAPAAKAEPAQSSSGKSSSGKAASGKSGSGKSAARPAKKSPARSAKPKPKARGAKKSRR